MEPQGVKVPSLTEGGGVEIIPELCRGVGGRMKIPLSLSGGRAEQSGVGKVKVESTRVSIRSIGGAAA